jgi:hypothetical protein
MLGGCGEGGPVGQETLKCVRVPCGSKIEGSPKVLPSLYYVLQSNSPRSLQNQVSRPYGQLLHNTKASRFPFFTMRLFIRWMTLPPVDTAPLLP